MCLARSLVASLELLTTSRTCWYCNPNSYCVGAAVAEYYLFPLAQGLLLTAPRNQNHYLADFWTPPKSQTFSLLIVVHIETQKVKVLRANQKNAKTIGFRFVRLGRFVDLHSCQFRWCRIAVSHQLILHSPTSLPRWDSSTKPSLWLCCRLFRAFRYLH